MRDILEQKIYYLLGFLFAGTAEDVAGDKAFFRPSVDGNMGSGQQQKASHSLWLEFIERIVQHGNAGVL